ncbi:T9SS C-terminal target domain-containing protein [Flavobacterium noncentrifugens]|uniref:Por secretion system C-terminal sorting domain-containing protein n=1 Tax=Flavobacterium noncentrifugens TaxID=1128970 RepID=A0A1G8WTD7_9FLAO|nr:T9SS type A sorting domain-containing protein [Flavobacterium noncentrifugens]GEP51044.1 T9SS C-terminal target domain-containing protein [Flavobacterium noncentrifugens]SDJ81403.1 Por secretion system C-terminal sorting domain-containing protein [Flavobacterium noncentrifugens]
MKKLLLSVLTLLSLTCSFAQLRSTGVKTIGAMTIKIDLDQTASLVTMTMTGPSTKWLTVGFNATTMSSNTPIDCFTYTTMILDQHLAGGHNHAVTDAVGNLTLVSNAVTGTTRTVVATRPFSTGDANDFAFTYALTNLNIIWAVGPSTNFNSEHNSRGASSVVFSNVLGTQDFSLADQTNVYPNPSDGNFNIENSKLLRIETVSLYDIQARLIREIKVNTTEATIPIAMPELPSGVYFIEIATAGDRSVKKIKINK